MAKDPKAYKGVRVDRLRKAMVWSRKRLRYFRDERNQAIKQVVGMHYAQDGNDKKIPLNLMEMMINIYRIQLAARQPKVMTTTAFDELKSTAENLGLALDHLLYEIQFQKTLEKVVVDAIYSIGIMKVGINSNDTEVEIEGVFHDVGQPFADAIDLDYWVQDMGARSYETIEYSGDRYRLPFDFVMESSDYENKGRLKATIKDSFTETGERKGETVTQGNGVFFDEYREYIDLWDIWLPKENLVITMPVEGEDKPIRMVEWEGPERGPYHQLSFSNVPANAMPLSPVSVLMDLHDATNKMYRKLLRQADRQKSQMFYTGRGNDDADRIVQATDGQAIRVDNAQDVQERDWGAPNQRNFAFMLNTKDNFSWTAGNLDMLGGLSPQSNTVGQDKLLSASAGRRMEDMQGRTVDFTKEVVRDLAWHLWSDPLIKIPLVKRIPGSNIQISTHYEPADGEGDFLDYNIEIDPYSLQHKTPQTQLKNIAEFVERFAVPLAAQMEQQGMVLDLQHLTELWAKYTDTPEIEDLIINVGEVDEESAKTPVHAPAVTKRTYERINRPGGTRSGKEAALAQTLMGAGVQDSEAAAMMRPAV